MNQSEKKKRIKELNKQLKQIDKQQTPLRKERNKLQKEISTEENKKYIGKCYKFHNGYSGDDKWWLYMKVVDVTKDGEFIILECQKTSLDEVIITQKPTHYPHHLFEFEITSEVFEKKFMKLINELEMIK